MVTFNTLWNNHPQGIFSPNATPCQTKGKEHFTNQCAIRVGVAMQKSGIDTTKFNHVQRCWFHPELAGHIIRAEELANALHKQRTIVPGLRSREKIAPKGFENEIKNRTGIIFFKDYFLRKGEITRNRSGDHIDFWNGSRLPSIGSWARIHSRFVANILRDFDHSDYHESKEIWFWPLS